MFTFHLVLKIRFCKEAEMSCEKIQVESLYIFIRQIRVVFICELLEEILIFFCFKHYRPQQLIYAVQHSEESELFFCRNPESAYGDCLTIAIPSIN